MTEILISESSSTYENKHTDTLHLYSLRCIWSTLAIEHGTKQFIDRKLPIYCQYQPLPHPTAFLATLLPKKGANISNVEETLYQQKSKQIEVMKE